MSLSELRFQQERRARLLNLTLTCMVVLAVIGLASCGPGDAEIADGVVVSGDPTADEQIEPVRLPPPERLVTTTTVPPTTTTHYHPPTTTTEAPVRAAAASAPVTYNGSSVWDDLARCESNGNWAINTGNGYYGGLQFSLQSWRSVGGTGYPHEHSRETQIEMGKRLQAVQGWGAWPACSRKLGLR